MRNHPTPHHSVALLHKHEDTNTRLKEASAQLRAQRAQNSAQARELAVAQAKAARLSAGPKTTGARSSVLWFLGLDEHKRGKAG